MNATEAPQRYRLEVRGLEGIEVVSEPEIEIDAAQSRWVPVRLQIPYGSVAAGSHSVQFDIATIGGPARITEKSVFLVPR
jgi:hypothetical protein